MPNEGFLKPRQALELAKKLGIDIVVTGAVSKFGVDRFAGLHVPFLVKLPQAQAEVGLRYRVLEFDNNKSQMQAREQQQVKPVGNLILDNSEVIPRQQEFDITKNQMRAHRRYKACQRCPVCLRTLETVRFEPDATKCKDCSAQEMVWLCEVCCV